MVVNCIMKEDRVERREEISMPCHEDGERDGSTGATVEYLYANERRMYIMTKFRGGSA